MARGIVSRLSVAVDVQSLCSLALEKADELMAKVHFLAACKFMFEEVTSSSIIVCD
ncbi:UNVERIFIED_CONTAM: hypothetical protein Sangu_1450000 [Sesamum angustifolium]|uniref:Uncharacterized protein n=1 Tax=Sesamum angustifolium TaxID=2727405 RepID=A0AAW2N8S7_9LAMI